MKSLLKLFLALCAVFSVNFAQEISCDKNPDCDCTNATYNASGPFPFLTMDCSKGQMNIYVPKCQLSHNIYNDSNLSLNKSTELECIGQQVFVNNQSQVVFHNLLVSGKCGNKLSLNDSHAIFSNVLYIYPAVSSPIITKNVLSVEMTCTIPLQYQATLNTILNPKIGFTQIAVPGASGTLIVKMALYTDASFSQVYSADNTELTVEDYAYVGISIPNLDASSFAVKIVRIYVSGEFDPAVYNLTNAPDSCPNPEYSDLIQILNNGNGTEARYRIKVFQIANEVSVRLMTDVSICLLACVPNCDGSRSLIKSSPTNMATVQLELTSIRLDSTSGAIDRFSKTSVIIMTFMSLLFTKFM